VNGTDYQIALLLATLCLQLSSLAAGLFLVRGGVRVLMLDSTGHGLGSREWLSRCWLGAMLGLALVVGGAILVFGKGLGALVHS
jgi:hypothetical protein